MIRVSVLYREPKVLKGYPGPSRVCTRTRVSVLYREPKVLKVHQTRETLSADDVSVLYREPKVLKAFFAHP